MIREWVIEHLENPSRFCLCHVSSKVEALRLYLAEALRVK